MYERSRVRRRRCLCGAEIDWRSCGAHWNKECARVWIYTRASSPLHGPPYVSHLSHLVLKWVKMTEWRAQTNSICVWVIHTLISDDQFRIEKKSIAGRRSTHTQPYAEPAKSSEEKRGAFRWVPHANANLQIGRVCLWAPYRGAYQSEWTSVSAFYHPFDRLCSECYQPAAGSEMLCELRKSIADKSVFLCIAWWVHF